MNSAMICDRCGSCYEHGGRSVRQGFGANMVEFDMCADCAASFDAWMDRGQMADTSERVTNQAETLHDTRELLESEVTVYLIDKVCTWGKQRYELRNEVSRWLDRQAAITERECREYEDALREQHHKRIAELKAELAKRDKGIERLRKRRGELVEQVRELTDRVAKLEGKGELEIMESQRDEARAKAELYRAKLGRVLDGMHEIEREVRNG